MNKQKRDFMNEMYNIICEIESLKPEPEECNVSCPPLGCPLGPCLGMCCTKGICDPCCVSKMPCNPSRCNNPCLKNSAHNGNHSSHPYNSSSMYINRLNSCPPPYNFKPIVSPCYIWNR
ncbi:hypothetical protein ACFW04_008118 [Cataglyphis niger]